MVWAFVPTIFFLECSGDYFFVTKLKADLLFYDNLSSSFGLGLLAR
jgi:hypothetical protein